MSLHPMLWALTLAQVETPTEALTLVAMADFCDQDGHGCYASQATIAAHARISVRTLKRVITHLEGRGLIRRGDQELISHLRQDRRPVVWDLACPPRQANLSPRDDDGVTDSAPRQAKTDPDGGPPVAYKPSTYPKENQRADVARGESTDGQVLGCASHRPRRFPSCPDCLRVLPPRRDQVRPADPTKIAAARAALTTTGRPDHA